jgi:hypothetical protein
MCNPVTTKAPELLLAKGEHEGYEWEVTNNGIGYRCGYVRIPAGHPWHGKDYDDVRTSDGDWPDVHGGLTFAEPDTDCGKGGGDDAWWLGFDCAHAGDAADPSLPGRDGKPLPFRMPSFGGDAIRTTDYVAAQCIALAEQALAAQHALHVVKRA